MLWNHFLVGRADLFWLCLQGSNKLPVWGQETGTQIARWKSQEFAKIFGDESKFFCLWLGFQKLDWCTPSVCLYWKLSQRKSKALTIMKQYRACHFFLSKVREAKRGVFKKKPKTECLTEESRQSRRRAYFKRAHCLSIRTPLYKTKTQHSTVAAPAQYQTHRFSCKRWKKKSRQVFIGKIIPDAVWTPQTQ